MGRPASHTFTHHGVTLDWMLVAVAVIALALLAGTTIRMGGGPTSDQDVTAGLIVLRGTDRLIAFEDHTHPDPDLSDHPVASLQGLGRVLGPFEGETLSRGLTLPDDTSVVSISFDLFLWDAADLPEVAVNGTPVTMTARFTDTPAGAPRHAHLSLRAETSEDALDLTLVGGPTGRWALDNLLVIAHRSADR